MSTTLKTILRHSEQTIFSKGFPQIKRLKLILLNDFSKEK